MDDSLEPSVTVRSGKNVAIVDSEYGKIVKSPSKQTNYVGRLSTRYSVTPGLFYAAPQKPLVLTHLPTYRLEPKNKPKQEFLATTLKRVVDSACQNRPTDRFMISRARRFCASVAREIQAQVTSEEYDRYRVVVKVIMVEQANQTGVSKMAFIWDTDKDMWSNYVRETTVFTINATVCVVYWE